MFVRACMCQSVHICAFVCVCECMCVCHVCVCARAALSVLSERVEENEGGQLVRSVETV